MNILIVHYLAAPPGEAGGAESAIRDQRDALQGLGHHVDIEFVNPERAWNRLKPDIVHFHTIHKGALGLHLLERAQRQGIPHVLSLHDYWIFCSGRMLLKTGTYSAAKRAESCSAVTGVCNQNCDSGMAHPHIKELVNQSTTVTFNPYSAEIFRRHGVEIDAVIPHGIDTNFFAPAMDRRNGINIITVSAWPEYATKGMYVLREALHMIGAEARCVSHVPRHVVRDELQAANIFVFPSRYEETFGLCLCEAMASGCACISSDVCGPRAQIDDGVNGLLFPNGDAHALAERIQMLIDDEAMRERLGANARAWAVQYASLERMGRDYVALYERVRRD